VKSESKPFRQLSVFHFTELAGPTKKCRRLHPQPYVLSYVRALIWRSFRNKTGKNTSRGSSAKKAPASFKRYPSAPGACRVRSNFCDGRLWQTSTKPPSYDRLLCILPCGKGTRIKEFFMVSNRWSGQSPRSFFRGFRKVLDTSL
jgi:hypothetical protein